MLLSSHRFCISKRSVIAFTAALSAMFAATPAATPLAPGIVDEASGIADSRTVTGAIWVEEDSGNPTQLQLVNRNGNFAKKVFIANADNRDWEDLALAPGPVAGTNYLYVADIGDNDARHNDYTIYRFPEPGPGTDTVRLPEKLRFQYPDGAHDAEALLVDPLTKDIFIVTKRDAAARVYHLPYPQSTTALVTATFITTLSFTGAVGGAVSADGKEIVIKTYGGIYYWARDNAETLGNILKKAPISLGYKVEPQGEAVCFAGDGSGFFTLSERGTAPSVSLNFYRRL
jgi:hypothetical protein